MKLIVFFTLLSISNVFAIETTCTPEQVKQDVIESLKAMSNYEGEEGKFLMENVKIGNVWSYPDFGLPTFYYVPVTMKMEMTSPAESVKTENGMWVFWYDATTCEDYNTIFDDLKPITL